MSSTLSKLMDRLKYVTNKQNPHLLIKAWLIATFGLVIYKVDSDLNQVMTKVLFLGRNLS